MRRILIASGAAALLTIALVATVAAAGPHGRAGVAAERVGAQSDVVADILGLSRDAIDDLRHDGLSLAQIAERQKVDPQKLVDALVTEWTARIEARIQAGALTPDRATTLRTQLTTRAKDMVYRTTLGGMQGAAVGAGPNAAQGAGPNAAQGAGRGMGAGQGSAAGQSVGRGAGRGAGSGECRATTTP